MLEPVLRSMPLWLVGVLLFVVCAIAREAGSLLYRRLAARRPQPAASGAEAESHVIAAIFGLLAFVLGLSFSIAVDRFDARRSLVTEEANAISTSYLRVSLFDEPHRSRLQSAMRDYARSRISPEGFWGPRMEAQMDRSQALRERIWAETRAAVYPVRETDMASYVLEAVNEMFAVGTRRELTGPSHMPTRIVATLFLYIIAASALLGYLLGDRPGLKRQGTTVLLLLFSVIIVTVLDVDRPQSGAIKVKQGALEDLVTRLDKDAALPRRP